MKFLLIILLTLLSIATSAQQSLPNGSIIISNTFYQAPDGSIFQYKGSQYLPNAYVKLANQLKIDSLLNTKIDKVGSGNSSYNFGSIVTTSGSIIQGLSIGRGSGSVLTNMSLGSQSLISNTTGDYNTALGYFTLAGNTIGRLNTAIGSQALFSNISGNNNLALGVQALAANISGVNNTGVGGNSVLKSNTTGSSNVAIGSEALFNNLDGNENTSLGKEALYANSSGSGNFAGGIRAGYTNTAGNGNVYIGYIAGQGNQIGGNNTYVGASAGVNHTGSNNVVIGQSASVLDLSGNNQLSIGNTIYGNLSSGDISIRRMLSLPNIPDGTAGTDSLLVIKSDNSIGRVSPLYYLAGGTRPNGLTFGLGGGDISTNTAFGFESLLGNTTGSYNTAFGYYTLVSNTTGKLNTAIGAQSLFKNTTGSYNLGVGVEALNNNTTGSNNTAIGGYDVLLNNTTGSANNAFGYASMYSNTEGNDNVALGTNTLYFNEMGNGNIAIGRDAGINNKTGNGNVFIGYISGKDNLIGYNNTYIGPSTGVNHTGSNNILIGQSASLKDVSESNKMSIGNIIYGDVSTGNLSLKNYIGLPNIPNGSAGADSLLVIGADNNIARIPANYYATIAGTISGEDLTGSVLAAGITESSLTSIGTIGSVVKSSTGFSVSRIASGTPLSGPYFELTNGSNGWLIQQNSSNELDYFYNNSGVFEKKFTLDNSGNATFTGNVSGNSDIRLKTNIQPLSSVSASLRKIHPVTFNLRANGQKVIGLIADEVAKYFPELVSISNDDIHTKSLDYMKFAASPLLKGWQELDIEVTALKEENLKLKEELAYQKKRLDNLYKVIEQMKLSK